MKVVVVCVNLRDVSDHDNRLTVTGPTHQTPINVMSSPIFLGTVSNKKELLIRGSTKVRRDSQSCPHPK